jgi:hypothetical protein
MITCGVSLFNTFEVPNDDIYQVWDLPRKYLLPDEPLKTFKPAVIINHDCQTVIDRLLYRTSTN